MKDNKKLVTWIAFAALLLIYLYFPTKNYFFDGIAFAQAIEDAPRLDTSLIHPNHLLYNVVGYLFYKLIQAVGVHLRAIQALQVLDSILSVLCAYVFFGILRLSLRSLYLCWTLTLLFAFSATWWKFSTDADAYVASVLFILVSFYLLHPAQRPRPLLVALAFSASMCFHQLAVIFYPVIVLGLLLQTPSSPARQRVLTILQFSVAGFAVTCGAYYYCFYLSTGTLSLGRFVRWITSFSPDASFTFEAGSNLAHTLRGQVRLFFGGRFNLLKGLMNPFIIVLMAAMAVAAVLLGWRVLRSFKGLKFQRGQLFKYDPRSRSLMLLCAVWAFVYIAFLFFWLPFHTFYRLFYFPALILLGGLALAPYLKPDINGRKYRAALLVAIIAVSNFLFLIFPYAHAQKYPPLALALEMNQTWQRGTVVYYASTNADNALFKYVNPSTLWKQMKPAEMEVSESELQEIYSRGGMAWLEASAIDRIAATPEGAAWLSAHARAQTRRELNDPAFNIKFIQIVPQANETSAISSTPATSIRRSVEEDCREL